MKLQFTCSVKQCDFLIRNETTYLILSLRNVLNHLTYSQKRYSNNINLHKVEFLALFDNFCVKLKLNFLLETGTHPIKMPTGECFQLLLNRSRVLIHEKVEDFTKVALENTKM